MHKEEVGRVIKSFSPSLAQRHNQFLAVNSNLHTVRRLCLAYTLHLYIYGNNGEINNLVMQQFCFCFYSFKPGTGRETTA